jgi:hypothetical protein
VRFFSCWTGQRCAPDGPTDAGFARDSLSPLSLRRLYEAYGGRARANLRITGLPVTSATLANILEDSTSDPLKLAKGRSFEGHDECEIALDFGPFEVKTVKLLIGEARSVAITLSL